MATSTTGLGGDNELSGTDCADKIIAGGGDDTVDGGAGSDTINASGGNDTIIYDETDYKILGGGGIDTLLFLNGDQTLKLGDKVVGGIEKVSFGTSSRNHVWFSAADIVRVSDTDQLLITGGKSNTIHFTDEGWNFTELTADGQSGIFSDGSTKVVVSLLVEVAGFSNDAQIVVSAPDPMLEDTASPRLTSSGTITVTDADVGQGFLIGGDQTYDLGLGSLQISLQQPASTSGPAIYDYTYSIDNDLIQYLGNNEHLTETFTLRSIDGTENTLAFTTNGADEFTVDTSPLTETITEYQDGSDEELGNAIHSAGGTISTTGTIPDNWSVGWSASPGNQPYLGAFHTSFVDGELTWGFDISDKYLNHLLANETVTQKFTVTISDGESQLSKDVFINLQGADDSNVILDPAGDDWGNINLSDQSGVIVRGLGAEDYIRFSGQSSFVYGDDGNDEIEMISVSGSLIRGGNGDDDIYVQTSTSPNEYYGDAGNDEFLLYGLDNSNIWGGPGSDMYSLGTNTYTGYSPVIWDFDFRSPSLGGDKIYLRAFGDSDTMNLTLTQTGENEYAFSGDFGSQHLTIFTLIGTNLTMADLADNIIDYNG